MIITLLAFVLSAIFTGPSFIKPLFKSAAVVYPANIYPFSTESPTEQMMQMLKSDDIRDMAIRDFDLFNRYQIDQKSKHPRADLYSTYSEMVSINKTQFESVEISVLDTDPVVAYQLCDSLLSYLNQKMQTMLREKYGEVVRIYSEKMVREKTQMDSMETALKIIREDYGILDFEEQVKPFSKEYYKAVASGVAGNGNSRLDKIEKKLAEKGGEYFALKEHLWRIRGQYNDSKKEYDVARLNLTKEITYAHIVTPPEIADKKSYPLRMLLVLGATVAAFFFAVVLIVILENLRGLAAKA